MDIGDDYSKRERICIMVYTQPELTDKVIERFMTGESLKVLGETFVQEIKIIEGKPIFPTHEQVDYFRSVGVGIDRNIRNNYRIYIGNDVEEVEERLNGVELPSRFLKRDSDFREHVLKRIRRVIGSPLDN